MFDKSELTLWYKKIYLFSFVLSKLRESLYRLSLVVNLAFGHFWHDPPVDMYLID